MTAILPQGLFNPPWESQPAPDDTESNVDNQEVLRRFWRVYAIQSDASQDDSSSRARNLFWRVWSSRSLSHTITSTTLTRLHHHCGQAFDLTPIGDSIELPPLGSYEDFPQTKRSSVIPKSPSSATSPSLSDLHHGGRTSSKSDQLEGLRISTSATKRTSQDELATSHRMRNAVRQPLEDTSGSTSQATSDSSSRPSLNRSTSAGRSRHVVAATVGKARARPQLPRRKSSTPKPPSTSVAPKSPLSSPKIAKVGTGVQESSNISLQPLTNRMPPPGLPFVPASSGSAGFALPPPSSWQSDESPPERSVLSSTAPQPPVGDLVDPGFRGKFVEHQKKTSSINLVGLNRMRKSGSIVRFADEVRKDIRKGKEKESQVGGEDTGSLLSQVMNVIEDESLSSADEDEGRPLEITRTMSQLSLLIKHKRSETGSQDLGPQSPSTAGPSKSKDKTKEEELLSMGRRDGVTKAGGVQVPRQQRLSDHDPWKTSVSSSPEPLF